jgi:predicted phage terminase large subunit-like protein
VKVTPQDAAKYLLRIRKAQQSFPNFVKALHPDLTWGDFQEELMETLDRLERRTLTNSNGEPVYRLLITMPPRHAKSFLATILFPIYYLARRPNGNVLSTSYNQDLAKTFGRQVRDLAREPLVGQAFADFRMSEESRAVDDWRTSVGGTYFATGLQGSTTGRAATLLILDDPIKAREEADSAVQRNKTWSYYISALTTRKQPEPDGTPPIEIVILTRWHPDDVAGRLMETEDWKEGRWLHINFPAIREIQGEKRSVLELPEDDPRYVAPGKLSTVAPGKRYYRETKEVALWPDRFALDELKRRQRLDPREFAALYQQSPYIKGGNLIKAGWWRTYKRDELQPSTVIIAADTAFKKTEQADYSVLMVLALDANADIYIVDVIRDKFDFPELKRRCVTLNTLWRGRGLRGFYIEDKASGQSLIQELKTASGISVLPYKVSGDKVSRVNAVTPLIEGGRVFVPDSAPWLDTFMDECQSFPSGKNDDQIDALSMGLDILSRISVNPNSLLNGPLDALNSLYAQLRPLVETANRRGPWVDNVGKQTDYSNVKALGDL